MRIWGEVERKKGGEDSKRVGWLEREEKRNEEENRREGDMEGGKGRLGEEVKMSGGEVEREYEKRSRGGYN